MFRQRSSVDPRPSNAATRSLRPPTILRLGLFVGLVSLLAAADRVAAGVYPVGNGAGCFVTVEAALAASAGDPETEIRLTVGHHLTGGLFLGRPLTIRGGYPSCDAAAPTPGARSTLENRDGRVLFVDGSVSSFRPRVVVEGVEIVGYLYWQGGARPGRTAGGLLVNGGIDLELRDVVVYASHSNLTGGAIRMQAWNGGEPHVLIDRSEISATSSEGRGGAIDCGAGDLHVRRSRIDLAHAAEGGGGLSVEHCSARLERTVIASSATESIGGGAYVFGSGARLEAVGSAFVGNDAYNGGGGFYVNGGTVELRNSQVIANTGPVSAAFGGYTGLIRFSGRACTRDRAGDPAFACSAVVDHVAGSGGGAIVSLRAGSYLGLDGTLLARNVPSAAGVVLIRAKESHLRASGTVFTDNDVYRLLELEGNDHLLDLEHVTIADNLVTAGHVEIDDTDPSTPNTPRMRMWSSIYRGTQQGFAATSTTGAFLFDCLVSDEPISSTHFVLAHDPGIAADGIHLLETSPAIDACEPVPGSAKDLDGEARGIDHDQVANARPGATADAGADEVTPAWMTVFVDGFESGDASAWSF